MSLEQFFYFKHKFVVGEKYEAITVKRPMRLSDFYEEDTQGLVIPETARPLGTYISSTNNGKNRDDHFLDDKGNIVINKIEYGTSTRYRVTF